MICSERMLSTSGRRMQLPSLVGHVPGGFGGGGGGGAVLSAMVTLLGTL